MPIHVRDGGLWKPLNGKPWVRDAGVWKAVNQAYARDAGVWKPLLDDGISFVGATTGSAPDGGNNRAPLTFPVGTEPGDTAVFCTRTDDGNGLPIVPSGWTQFADTSDHSAGAKVLTAGDISSPPLTLSGNDTNAWICMVFRGVGNAAGLDVTAQIKTASGTQYHTNEVISCGAETVPVVAVAFVGGKGDSANAVGGLPNLSFVGGLQDGSFGVINGSGDARMAAIYKIMNSSPINLTATSGSFGSQRIASCECYLKKT